GQALRQIGRAPIGVGIVEPEPLDAKAVAIQLTGNSGYRALGSGVADSPSNIMWQSIQVRIAELHIQVGKCAVGQATWAGRSKPCRRVERGKCRPPSVEDAGLSPYRGIAVVGAVGPVIPPVGRGVVDVQLARIPNAVVICIDERLALVEEAFARIPAAV